MSEWISVKGRLPESLKSVLAVRRGTVTNMYFGKDGLWRTDGFGVFGKKSFNDITHWMPLPPPPNINKS